MSTTNKHWYLLTSKPGQDEKAEQQLLNQNYEVYRPLAKRLRKRRGKMVDTVESLFPRYLFICLDISSDGDNWFPIRSTRGVSGFVRFGIEPAKVPANLIMELKSKEEGLSEKVVDLDRFKKGEGVLIESGAFNGLQAVFDCYDGQKRSFVLLEMMGKLAKLPMNTADLARIV